VASVATRPGMCATEQSVYVGREIPFALRDYWPTRIRVQVRARAIDATEVPRNAEPLGDVHVGRAVPAAGMPSTVGAGELISTEHFRCRLFTSQPQPGNRKNHNRNSKNLSHHSPLK